LPDGALDDIALAQAVLAHLGEGDVHVVRPGQVAGGAHEGVPLRVEHVEDAGDRDEHVILADHGLRFGLAVAAPAVPVPEPVPAAAPSAAVVVCLTRWPAARRHGLPVPATTLLAAVVAATVTAAVITAGLLAAALVPAALIAAAVVTAGLAGRLVPAARRLVVAAPVPAAPVTALRLAWRGFVPYTRLGVFTRALRRAARLLGSRRLGGNLLSCGLLGRGLLGRAVRPVGHGCLVEAELLPGSVRADPAGRAGAQACRGTVSDAGLRACVWFHSVLLPQASRVSSRGRDTLVRTFVRGARLLPRRSALPGLD